MPQGRYRTPRPFIEYQEKGLSFSNPVKQICTGLAVLAGFAHYTTQIWILGMSLEDRFGLFQAINRKVCQILRDDNIVRGSLNDSQGN